ncbi:MAG: DUF1214 domain-containing protein [Myxococcota bacterium]
MLHPQRLRRRATCRQPISVHSVAVALVRGVAGAFLLLAGVACAVVPGAERVALVSAAATPAGSWDYLGDALDDAAGQIEALAASDLERREGYRWLARSLFSGFDRFLEYANPAIPEFYRAQSAHRKFAGDNPDQLYHVAAVASEFRYRVRGQWSAPGVRTELIELSVYGGGLSFDDDTAKRRLVAYMDERNLEIAEDGSFEVVVGVDPAEGNWLRLEEDAEMLLIRRYFASPQPADRLPLSIERIDGVPPREPLTQRELAKGLIASGAFLRETAKIWGRWYPDVLARHGPNRLDPLPDDGDLLTPAGLTYLQGAWSVADGEVLVVRFRPPDVPYWGFLPMNIWMESLDWRVAPVSRNGFDSQLDPDGMVTLVVSEVDPGHPNWIATLGHRRGLMSMRLARLGEQPLPEVETTLLPRDELAGFLASRGAPPLQSAATPR